MNETLLNEDWYSVADCINCSSLYVRGEPENAVFCKDCRQNTDPITPPQDRRNLEAEQQANITLGREVATQINRGQ